MGVGAVPFRRGRMSWPAFLATLAVGAAVRAAKRKSRAVVREARVAWRARAWR